MRVAVRGHRRHLPLCVPESAGVPSCQVTPAGSPARDALATARGPKARAGPARVGPHPGPRLPCRNGNSPGAPGRRARPRAARPPRAPRGTGGRPWRARRRRLPRAVPGRAAGGSQCESGFASAGGGLGAAPGRAPRPAPASYCSGLQRLCGPPAGAGRWGGEVLFTGLAAAGSRAWPSAPGGPGGLRACPDDTFPSRLSLPRVRGGRSRYDTPP